MNWTTSYILVRPLNENRLEVVHTAEKLKEARYWLQYIAEPGDAIFTTPLHNQYKGNGDPIYMSNLVERGRMDFNEAQWKLLFMKQEINTYEFVQKNTKSETAIIDLSSNPRTLSIDELKNLINLNSKQIDVLLSDANRWLKWESAVGLSGNDVYIVSVNPDSEWPLTLTIRPTSTGENKLTYDAQMQFVVKPRAAI